MKNLKLVNLTKRARGSHYFYNVNLKIQPGSVYGFVSRDSYAIASFINVIRGIDPPDSGSFVYKGEEVSPKQLRRNVGIASSSLSLIDGMTVSENVFLGSYRKHSMFGFLSSRRLKIEAYSIFSRLATHIDCGAKLSKIGDNGRQMVEIARLLVREPSIYIFDRITGSLSPNQYEALFEEFSRLRKKDVIIIMIPSGPQDVRTFVDRLFFINNEHVVEIDDCKKLTQKSIDELFLSSGALVDETIVNDPIFRARLLIENNCSEPMLNYQALAQSLDMSYESFRRRFKHEIGLSPNRYFLKMKIDLAKELLSRTGMSVKKIAERVGVPDPYHFSKLFKEKEKCAPVEFRKRNREGDSDERT
jgi:ABC-type sugar transport system ATPase subunit